jgi:cytoskeletal protein CcmA (bactofilin family)
MLGNKRNKSSKKAAKIDTFIGENTQIKGDLLFSGGLWVHGTVLGNIIAEDDSSVLKMSECGLIEGEVRVPNVELNGSVKGDVYATQHIELAENARVSGNVYYNLIEMARGAEVNGNLVKRGDKAPAALEAPKTTANTADAQADAEPVAVDS